eukprot:TRINITY_DN5441_c0_g1_i1.p1 TRINITY_DN5441_c0_g1~~TRINITY_DN5441_c0_g1_i1.p1  ORF type:complete len:214 (+),score=93.53 TRINITY_DN5441_c0_g1_i1:75-716(+)
MSSKSAKSAKVLFDFAARKPEELSLVKGEMLSNVAAVSDDWWKGSNKAGARGIFPAKYVVVLDENKVLRVVLAKYDFAAKKADRISFRKGEQIDVLAEVSSEWWTGRNAAGQTGLFPSNYVIEAPSGAAPLPAASSSSRRKTSQTLDKGRSARKETAFTSATLKDFPIQFKMPSQSLPVLRIGVNESLDDLEQRTAVRRQLAALDQHIAEFGE